MGFSLKLVLFSVIVSIFSHVQSQRAKDNMFEAIDGAFACFRRLNGTHQFGCTSSRSGNVGVIHVVNNSTDLDWLLQEGLAAPYMPVLQPAMFTRSALTKLKESGKINGVILVHNASSTERPPHFSHEDSCPNRYSGLSSQQTQTCGVGSAKPWNTNGTGMMLVDWGFPIFYITEPTHIASLYECYKDHNVVSHPSDQLDRALCAMQLRSHMFAAVSTRKCMARNKYYTIFTQVQFCDPLGGRNIWQTLFPRSTQPSLPLNSEPVEQISQPPSSLQEANRSITVLAARMDASSMFDGLVPGAVGAVTGIVTLLSTATLLHSMIPAEAKYDKNVMFVLLSGESYDYIGSSRMVYDMQQGMFPVKPDSDVLQPPPIGLHHLGPFIEISQISKSLKNGEPLYLHRTQQSSPEVQSIITSLKSNGATMGVNINDNIPASSNLPPASLQTFLASDPDISGFIIADHPLEYSNRYYHSIYDDLISLKYMYANGSKIRDDSIQMLITNLSTALAHTLFEHVTGEIYQGASNLNVSLVDEMLHCYLEQSNCSLFRAATAGNSAGIGKPPSLYVGVSNWVSMLTVLTGAALALLTGKPTDHTEMYCHNNASTDQVYQYIWVSKDWYDPNSTKVCMQTTMNFTAAVSPAFIIDGYNMSSGKYSTWTESVWPELSARMFLKPSFQHEVLTLSLGISVLLLSFASVYFVKSRKEVFFNPGLPST